MLDAVAIQESPEVPVSQGLVDKRAQLMLQKGLLHCHDIGQAIDKRHLLSG